jgi:hypothetical protein
MGIRGELYSTKVVCDGRSYFFNVKENRMGDLFLNIVESKPVDGAGFDRHSVVVFKDDMRTFVEAFQKALKFIETGSGGADSRPGAKDARARPARDKSDDGRDDWRSERGYRDGRDDWEKKADPEADRRYARSRGPGRVESRKPFAPRAPRPEGMAERSEGFTAKPRRAPAAASPDGERKRRVLRATKTPAPSASKKRAVVRKKSADKKED